MLTDFERHFCHRLLPFRMKRQFTPTLTFYLNDIYVYYPVFYIAMVCSVQIISLKLHLSYNFVIARAQERRIDTKIKKEEKTEDNRMFGKVNDIEFNKPWAFA